MSADVGSAPEYAELVALGVGEHDPTLLTLADVNAWRREPRGVRPPRRAHIRPD